MIKNIMQVNIEYFHREVEKACNSHSIENKKVHKGNGISSSLLNTSTL